jgi:hypothetical protein
MVKNLATIAEQESPNGYSITDRLNQIEQLIPKVREALRRQSIIK